MIGILGGMGPEATVDLFKKIFKAMPAEKDQEHLRIIVVNDSQVLKEQMRYCMGEQIQFQSLRKIFKF
ncbi:MAG: hypothetical protein ACE5R6_11800 [Candidatus Heimdallarchaeota archaeon]